VLRHSFLTLSSHWAKDETITLLLFEGMYCKQYGHCFFPLTLREKFTSLDVSTLCFSEKLPAAGNLALYSEGNDIKWNGQGFLPQIHRAGLTTVYVEVKCVKARQLHYGRIYQRPSKKGVSLIGFSHQTKSKFIQTSYSKASRYTALRSTDLGDTRFLIGSQNTWATRFLAKSLEDARFLELMY
jgi:hypothetical protein